MYSQKEKRTRVRGNKVEREREVIVYNLQMELE